MKLSVVIPARNEALNIGMTLDLLDVHLKKVVIDYEIIVVDDGSEDDTAAEVRKRSIENTKIRLVKNLGKHGYGYAVRVGLDTYNGDAVVIVMADGSDSPEDVVKYYSILLNQADCAFGSRWMAGGKADDYPKVKRFVNRIANNCLKLLFHIPYNDVTNAFKGYRRCVIDGCRPFLSPHFNLTVELPLKAIVRGYSYRIIPITWKNRKFGRSSLHIEEMGSRYLYIVLNVWLEKLLTFDDYKRSSQEVSQERIIQEAGIHGK